MPWKEEHRLTKHLKKKFQAEFYLNKIKETVCVYLKKIWKKYAMLKPKNFKNLIIYWNLRISKKAKVTIINWNLTEE